MLTVGPIIRARRKERLLTLGDVAKRLSAGTEDISAFERDERSLGDALGSALIQFLDLDGGRLAAAGRLIEALRTLRPRPRDRQFADFVVSDSDHFCADRRAHFARSWADIETIAAAMRQMLPVPPTGKISALTLFERLDEITLPVHQESYRVEYAVRRLPHAVEARSRADVDSHTFEVAVSPQAYRDMARGFPRMLFTVCHEIGHLVLHRSALIAPNVAPGTSRIPPYASTEWQANAFATAFISPLEELLALHDSIGSLSAVDVHRNFGCSRAAAELRLKSVEKRFAERIVRFQPQMLLPLR